MAQRKLLRGQVIASNRNPMYVLVGSTGEKIIWGFDVVTKEVVELNREEILSKLRSKEWYIRTPEEI